MSRRTITLLSLTAAAGILLLVLRLPVAQAVVDLVTWIRGAGATGVLVFALVYVTAVVALLPGSILTLGAGFLYGPLVGTLLVSPVSVAAATVAFVLGRTAARDWIAQRMAGVGRFDAVDRAVGHEGFKIVLLLRLSPLFPFALLNYALGLTRVRLRDYVIASWIGMLPGTVLYVYLGSLLTSATQLASGAATHDSSATQLLYWGGLVATGLVAWLVTRTARRALHRSLGESSSRSSTVGSEVSS
ncbi:MAG: hypothetical protein GEV06_27060 [Luteitalea sp.]|nr:hypothetical protein [Luteitalea sp.]